MNKAELVELIAKRTNTTKSLSEQILDEALVIIQKSISKGEEVKLVGFGTFTRIAKKARSARNPKTGQEVKIPAQKVPRFRPGKDFKELVK